MRPKSLASDSSPLSWELLGYALALLALIRAIPEFFIGALPTGFDSSNSYLVFLTSDHLSLGQALKSFNLLYYILQEVHLLLHSNALITIKLVGVIVYVLMCLSFALVIRSITKVPPYLLAIGTLVFGLELSTLRLSWDLFRNELGLAFLLLAFWQWYTYKKKGSLLNFILAIFSAALVLASHQIVAIFMLILILLYLLSSLEKRLTISKLSAPIILPIIFLVLWPLLAQHISYHGITLWASLLSPNATANPINPFSLFWLLFSPPLLLLALLGYVRHPSPALLLTTLLLLVQALSPFFFHTAGFYLWDRWMYFLVLPFSILAVQGMQTLGNWLHKHLTVPPLVTWLVCAVILIAPSFKFFWPTTTLFPANSTQEIANYFPPNLMWNAIGTHSVDSIISSAKILRTYYVGSVPIYVDWRYGGIARFYLPDMMPHIIFTHEGFNPGTHYYIFGVNYSDLPTGTQLEGTTIDCPVYVYPS